MISEKSTNLKRPSLARVVHLHHGAADTRRVEIASTITQNLPYKLRSSFILEYHYTLTNQASTLTRLEHIPLGN